MSAQPTPKYTSFLRTPQFGSSGPLGCIKSALPARKTVAPSVTVAPGEKPWAKFLIGGGVTVLFEAFCGGHFLEFLKIAKQTSNDSYFKIARDVTATKGIIGTLDGFVPWGLLQVLAKGAVFSLGQAEARHLLEKTSLSNDASMVLSGGMGGFVQGVVMSPLLLLKTRVMTDRSFRNSGGAWETSKASARIGARVVAAEGPAALMKGVTVFASKRFADWTTRYFFVVMVENIMKKSLKPGESLSTAQVVAAGLMGGTISALVTIPIDVLVATYQSANNAGKKVSGLDVYREQIRSGGLKGTLQYATKGTLARVAHVALTTLLMKTVTSKVYDILMR